MPASPAIEFTEERLEIFPTHVFKRVYAGLDDVNRRLVQLCLDKEKTAAGLTRSNVGSWHSKSELFKWQDPAITVFASLVQDFVHGYVAERLAREPAMFRSVFQIEGWANVSRAGDYAKPHVHPSSNFALVYYPDAGDAEPPAPGEKRTSGVLELLDPRGRPEMFQTPGVSPADTLSIAPRTGLMLLFPSWLYHFVNPYKGTRPRISLACNVTVAEVQELGVPENESQP